MVTAVDQAGYWSPTLITTTTVTTDTTVTMVMCTWTVSLAPCVMEVAGKRKHVHKGFHGWGGGSDNNNCILYLLCYYA